MSYFELNRSRVDLSPDPKPAKRYAPPKDHPWHRGLWFSWKYLNGVNYWEENRKGKAYGGYAGLSIRINKLLTDGAFLTGDGLFKAEGMDKAVSSPPSAEF